VYGIVFKFDREGRDGRDGGEAENLARANVEARPMARALNGETVQIAFGNGASVVRAHIFDSVEFVIHVEYGNEVAIHFGDDTITGEKVINMNNAYPIGHGRNLVWWEESYEF
jgi:hypothetical protein